MSHAHDHSNTVAAPVVGMAGALVVFSLLLTTAVSAGLMQREAVPAIERTNNRVSAVTVRNLTFADRADGAVMVTDAATQEPVAQIASETKSGGFIRGVLRGMARERHLRGIGSEPPFALTLWADGSLSLADSATGRTVELGAFGPDNRAAFVALLGKGGAG